jgi:ComF family protein
MNTLLSKLPYWREAIRETFFPQGCALCGSSFNNKPFDSVNYSPDSFYGLCCNCRKKLEIPEAERGRCSLCGQPLVSEQGTCLPCRNGSERSFDRLISLFPYMGHFKKVLGEYKFKRRLGLGNLFVEKRWQGLDILQETEDVSGFCWVPVPARPGKIKQSGWDQIDYLAKLLEVSIHYRTKRSEPSIPIQRCLKRLPSVSQKRLNKENRLQNLQVRIIIDTRIVPKTAILFDDVYTTGATMDACATALKSGGTEKVYGICLCYD